MAEKYVKVVQDMYENNVTTVRCCCETYNSYIILCPRFCLNKDACKHLLTYDA